MSTGVHSNLAGVAAVSSMTSRAISSETILKRLFIKDLEPFSRQTIEKRDPTRH